MSVHARNRGEKFEFHPAVITRTDVIGKDATSLTHFVITFKVDGDEYSFGIPFGHMDKLRSGIELIQKTLQAEKN